MTLTLTAKANLGEEDGSATTAGLGEGLCAPATSAAPFADFLLAAINYGG